MLSGSFAVALAAVIAALPLTAHADLWINYKNLRVLTAQRGCHLEHANDQTKTSVVRCGPYEMTSSPHFITYTEALGAAYGRSPIRRLLHASVDDRAAACNAPVQHFCQQQRPRTDLTFAIQKSDGSMAYRCKVKVTSAIYFVVPLWSAEFISNNGSCSLAKTDHFNLNVDIKS